jgi:arginase
MALRVLGVPSAAGAYGNGVALAPRALREAGLLEALSGRGVEVADAGDLPSVPFRPDSANPKQQNIDKVIEVASDVASRVADISAAGDVPLVLGGNCSLTLGVIVGLCSRHPDLGLAYFDGDVDMSTPARTVSGVVDAMGIATMLGLEGANEAFAGIGPRVPLMDGHDIAIIGYDEAELDAGPRDLLGQRGVHLIDGSAVRGRAAAAAADALDALEHRDGLIVHFDVDVVDSTDLPLGQFPHFNQGVSLADAVEVLTVLASAPDVLAIIITEINPDNDPEGIHVRRLADGIVDALGRSMSG